MDSLTGLRDVGGLVDKVARNHGAARGCTDRPRVVVLGTHALTPRNGNLDNNVVIVVMMTTTSGTSGKEQEAPQREPCRRRRRRRRQ